jgi:hypothetical protein
VSIFKRRGARGRRDESVETGILERLVAEVTDGSRGWVGGEQVRATRAWDDLAERPEADRVAAAVTALDRASAKGDYLRSNAYVSVSQELLRRKLALTATDRVALLAALLAYARRYDSQERLTADWDPTKSVLRALERGGEVEPLPRERELLEQVRAALVVGDTSESKRCLPRVDALLGADVDDRLFTTSDRWARALEETAAAMGGAEETAAHDALRLAVTARASKPSAKWQAQAAALGDQHGASTLAAAVSRLLRECVFAVADEHGQVDTVVGDALRGLCWITAALPPTDDLAAGPGAWLVAGWAKVPGRGPACRKAASGAAWALARLGDPGAAQLGRARSVVRQPQAVTEIDTAITDAAAALGIPREEFEERVVPSYGLDIGARADVPLGEHVATLSYAAGKTTVAITAPDGRVRKTVPAAVRRDHAGELAGLKTRAKDVTAMVGAQRMRLERLLLEDRRWEPDVWRARYVDHPLVSVLARNLIWQVDDGATCRPVIAADGQLRDVAGNPVDAPVGAGIRLWHPATVPTAEVQAWRRRVEETRIVQPFKQAHREVYLLTDAERDTDVYSNRFAGHILRQHQFAALARARGWRYALQGAFDSPDEQGFLELPSVGLRASFWVDRPWDADNDWNESGIFNHVLTDQVRFHRAAGDDVHLREVPVRVLSEVLRDVDLFVGVASIGNDPTWRDTGDARRTWDQYWNTYSFGELGAAAEVRRDLLARLLPKLAIADVVTLDERFLRVRGSLRTYKIHLGSGNILMEPNDQYLCIVPGRGEASRDDVMLPFEGDRTLSIVLSKALLLAADDKITDTTITSQIKRR